MKKYIKKHPNIIIFSILCIISSIIYIRFILEQDKQTQAYLKNIISEQIEINCLNDINEAFDRDLNNDFKTVMKWNL